MTAQGNSTASLRLERLEFSRLGWAFAISLALHLACWGGYAGGKKLGVWDKLHVPAWVQKLTQPIAQLFQAPPKPLFQESEPPLMFVNTKQEEPNEFANVNPAQATIEPPQNAKFYSSHNSRAANAETDRDTGEPKVIGTQANVPTTEDVPRTQPTKLQPVLGAPKAEEGSRPKPKLPSGDLALAKPDLNSTTDTGVAEKYRPRRLSEVLPNANRPPSAKLNRGGGVKPTLSMAALDAKATPFGTYDSLLIQAIVQRWYDLLDDRNYAYDSHGRVVLLFKLHYDGRVTDVEVVEHTVSETLSLLCQKAVLDPAPFDKWPKELRLMVAEEFRRYQFTFNY